MTVRKYGFPSSMGVEAAKAEALGLAAAATGLPVDVFEAEDTTSPEHEANNEILIRVTEKTNTTPNEPTIIFSDGE